MKTKSSAKNKKMSLKDTLFTKLKDRKTLLSLFVFGSIMVTGTVIAFADDAYAQWSMTTSGDTVVSTVGSENITMYNKWQPAIGQVGDAIEFTDATSYGIAHGSESDNPGTSDFGMSVTFTSNPIPEGVGYSGNVIQKGLANKQGQVKISLVPSSGGTVACRIKGTNGYRTIGSKVIVDDGAWHKATCWRTGIMLGLTVDGITRTTTFNPGSIVTDQPLRIGNKLSTADWTDQHFGKTDCTAWVIGLNAREQALKLTPC